MYLPTVPLHRIAITFDIILVRSLKLPALEHLTFGSHLFCTLWDQDLFDLVSKKSKLNNCRKNINANY